MSGVLIKEWSTFVLKEVKARKQVEASLAELFGELRRTREEAGMAVSLAKAEVAMELLAAKERVEARAVRTHQKTEGGVGI